jgi:hypothetical protein
VIDQQALLGGGMFLSGVLFAAGAYALATRRALRDIRGLRKKYDRLLAFLNRHADTKEEQMEISDIIEGR